MQTVPNSTEVSIFIDEEIRVLENAGCISKSLSLWAIPVIIIPKKPDPLNLQKQQIHLVLDYWSLNKSINAAHKGNSVISYYPLPNIRGLSSKVAKVCNIFLIRPEVRLPPSWPNTGGKAKNCFCHNKW